MCVCDALLPRMLGLSFSFKELCEKDGGGRTVGGEGKDGVVCFPICLSPIVHSFTRV